MKKIINNEKVKNKRVKIMKNNKKRKIVITGAGTGLGKDAAINLARRGHIVYATTHFESESEELKKLANEKNLELYSFKLDILKEDDLKKLDNIDFDTLINNAAICDSGSVAETDVDRYKNILNTNVLANIRITQIAIKKFVNQKYGKIIFISSLFGLVALPFYSPYSCSKFAIECFAKSLKEELKLLKDKNIKIQVKIIEPGAYKTGFNEKMAKRKYEWMENQSYFKYKLNYIKNLEEKMWNFIQLKSFKSITKQYIQAVESTNNKFKYTAPKLQSFSIKLYSIFETIFSF